MRERMLACAAELEAATHQCARGRGRRGRGAAALARGRQIHLPRRARLRLRARRQPAHSRPTSRKSSADTCLGVLRDTERYVLRTSRRADGADAGIEAPDGRAGAADRGQIDPARARASARHRRLCRRQALQRQRRGDRRGPLRRPVHQRMLHRADAQHPDAAPQGRMGDEPGRLRRRRPQRQDAAQDHRILSARGTLADVARGFAEHRARHAASARPPARARVHAARPLQPLRHRARLCAEGPLQFRTARARRRRPSRAPMAAWSRASSRNWAKASWRASCS